MSVECRWTDGDGRGERCATEWTSVKRGSVCFVLCGEERRIVGAGGEERKSLSSARHSLGCSAGMW